MVSKMGNKAYFPVVITGFLKIITFGKTHRSQQGKKAHESCVTLENIYRNCSYQNLLFIFTFHIFEAYGRQ